MPTWFYDDRVADLNLVRRYLQYLTIAPDRGGSGKKIEKDSGWLFRPLPNRETLQYLSGKDEGGDDQGGEELSNRNAARRAIVIESSIVILRSTMFSNRFFENGISADESSRDADHADVRKWLPQAETRRQPQPRPQKQSERSQTTRIAMVMFGMFGSRALSRSGWWERPREGEDRTARISVRSN